MDAAKETDFAWFEDQCRIRPEQFEEELLKQPELMRDVGMRRAYAQDDERRAKDDLVLAQETAGKVAEMKLSKAGTRATKDAVARRVADDPVVSAAMDLHRSAVLMSARWDALYTAVRERGFALKTLGEAYVAGYLTPRAVHDTDRRESPRRFPGGMTDTEHEASRHAISKKRPSVQELRDRVNKGPKRERLQK